MVSYDAAGGRIEMVQGEEGSITLRLIGREIAETDTLILNVRELPSAESPLLLHSENLGPVIRISCDAAKAIPVGVYSAQIFWKTAEMHCPVQIWPKMGGTPSEKKCMKNFIVYQRV